MPKRNPATPRNARQAPPALVFAAPPADLAPIDDAGDELEHVLGELGDVGTGGKVKVYRLNSRDRNDKAFIDEMAPTEFSVKGLRDKYGGGIYLVMAWVPQEDPRTGEKLKKLKLCANEVITIEGAPRTPAAPIAPAAATPASSPPDMLTVLAKMQEASDARLERVLLAIAPKAPPSSSSQLEDTLRILGLFKQAGLMGAPAATVDPISLMKTTLDAAGKLADLRGDPDRGDDDEGEPRGGGGLWRAAERIFTPVIHQMVAQAQQQQQGFDIGATAQAEATAAGSPAAVLPGAQTIDGQATPVPPAAPASSATETGENMGFFNGDAMASIALKMAVSAAERNDPPAQYVNDDLIDNLPGKLLDTLEEPDWLERLASVNDRVRLYPMWFTQLKDLIQAELKKRDTE